MALDTALLKPAQIGTSEIATKNDITVASNAITSNIYYPNTTTIDGGKITTNAILVNNLNATGGIVADTIKANAVTVGQTVHSTGFPYPTGDIVGTPSGFRLKAGAAGTSVDPTIYGAYIKGGTLNGVNLVGEVLSVNNMKFNDSNYPSNTANVLVKGRSEVSLSNTTSYGTVLTFVSASYGTGFRADRIVALSKMFIFDYSYSREVSNSDWGAAGRVQVSIDGAAYYDILHILEGWLDFNGNVNPPYSGKIYIPLVFSNTISLRASATSTNGYNNTKMAFDVECFNFNFS